MWYDADSVNRLVLEGSVHRHSCYGVVFVALMSLGQLAAHAVADDTPSLAVAKWYADDPTRLPQCKVDPNIEKAYPNIHAVLAALKYALANDELWAGKTWNQDEDLAAVRKGAIDALDDPFMTFGWKANQKPLKEIKKGAPFNDAVTKSGHLAEFHVHTFLTGNDTDPIGPRPPAEVMRTLAHELAHVWDHRVHTITKYSVDLGGFGLPYDFQKLVPAEPFTPQAIGELNRLMGKGDPLAQDGAGAKDTPNSDDDDRNEEENPNKFYVYAIDTSGWSLWVDRPDAVAKLQAGRGLTDSGLGPGIVISKKLSSKGFLVKEECIAYLKTRVTLGKYSRWTGQWVKFKGEEYRTVHLPEIVPSK
jgi:hypothetical protein